MISSDINDNDTQYTVTKEKSPYIPSQSPNTDLSINKQISNISAKPTEIASKEPQETKQISVKQTTAPTLTLKEKPALKTLTISSSNNIGQNSPTNFPKAPQSTKNETCKPKIFQNIQVNLKSSSPKSKKTGEVTKK